MSVTSEKFIGPIGALAALMFLPCHPGRRPDEAIAVAEIQAVVNAD